MSETLETTPSIEVGELLSRVDRGEPLLLLDVRNDDEFASWRLALLSHGSEAEHSLGRHLRPKAGAWTYMK